MSAFPRLAQRHDLVSMPQKHFSHEPGSRTDVGNQEFPSSIHISRPSQEQSQQDNAADTSDNSRPGLKTFGWIQHESLDAWEYKFGFVIIDGKLYLNLLLSTFSIGAFLRVCLRSG